MIEHWRKLHPILSQTGEHRRLQIRFRRRRRQIDVSIGNRIEQRANELRPADGGAALGADVGRQPIEKDDLPVEQDDGDLGPRLLMNRRTPGLSFASGGAPSRRKDVGRWFKSFAATSRHPVSPASVLVRDDVA